MIQHTAILIMADQFKVVWSIDQRHFLWPWTIPTPQFQGHAVFWRWISQKRYDIGHTDI